MRKYKAIATLQDSEGRAFDVVVYSLYNSMDETLESLSHFVKKGYNILRIVIE